MNSVRVLVDADSCPADVREYLLKYTKKICVPIFFVANKKIPAKNAAENFSLVLCPKESQAADNWILQNASEFDIVVTRDIPLSAALVQKKIRVMNDRGTLWNAENIRRPLKERELNMQMAALGLGSKKRDTYGQKEFTAFADCFDREIQKLI